MDSGSSTTPLSRRPPRSERPRCGARCRSREGRPCLAPVVWVSGDAAPRARCRMHGGLATGPRSLEGRAHIGAVARARLLEHWQRNAERPGGCPSTHFPDGWTPKDLSARLGTSVSTVYARLRASTRLLADGARVALCSEYIGVREQGRWTFRRKRATPRELRALERLDGPPDITMEELRAIGSAAAVLEPSENEPN